MPGRRQPLARFLATRTASGRRTAGPAAHRDRPVGHWLAATSAVARARAAALRGAAPAAPRHRSPPARAVAGATFTATAVARPAPQSGGRFVPAAAKGPAVGPPIPRSSDGSEYLDGIPTRGPTMRPSCASEMHCSGRRAPACSLAAGTCRRCATVGELGRDNCASAVLSDVPVDQQGRRLAVDRLAGCISRVCRDGRADNARIARTGSVLFDQPGGHLPASSSGYGGGLGWAPNHRLSSAVRATRGSAGGYLPSCWPRC